MIHPTALISKIAKIGANVSVGAYTIIHDDVEIGDNTTIDAYCEIGYPTPRAIGQPLSIGKGALIRSHCIFYQGSVFGPKLVTGHHVTAREGTQAGANLQIGTLCDIQGTCQIGDYVRFHSNVHIGQHSKVGNFVWIFPYVVLTNDPHPPSNFLRGVVIHEYAVIATMSVILPGVEVGVGALVAAHSSVSRNVEPYTVVAGTPAKYMCKAEEIMLKDGSGRSAYPWRRHFIRGYPDQVTAVWLAEFGEGKLGKTS